MQSQRHGLSVPQIHEFVFDFVGRDNSATLFATGSGAHPAPQAEKAEALASQHLARAGEGLGPRRISMRLTAHLETENYPRTLFSVSTAAYRPRGENGLP